LNIGDFKKLLREELDKVIGKIFHRAKGIFNNIKDIFKNEIKAVIEKIFKTF
jgi:hypothetical protein